MTTTQPLKTVFMSTCLIVGLLVSTACSRDPQKMVESGKKYIAQKNYAASIARLGRPVLGMSENMGYRGFLH